MHIRADHRARPIGESQISELSLVLRAIVGIVAARCHRLTKDGFVRRTRRLCDQCSSSASVLTQGVVESVPRDGAFPAV